MIAARAQNLAVVGDIGGTNARLAVADLTTLSPGLLAHRQYRCADFPDFEALLQAYLNDLDTPDRPAWIVMAVAATLWRGSAQFVNLDWRIDEARLEALGFLRPRLVNDFHALALACPLIDRSELRPVGPGCRGDAAASLAVIGAGTGFGAAALVRDGMQSMAHPSEGGHIGFAPADAVEGEIWRILCARFGRVSVERILSGPGLVNLYRALAEINGEVIDPLLCSPAAIVSSAQAGHRLAGAVTERFCLILGSVAGDLVLAHAGWGGLYINGAIANSLFATLNAGGFRQRLEAKGRMADYLRQTPSYVIARTDAALMGAAGLAAEIAAG